MNELSQNIASLSWWIGVVFVGVLTSLFASWLKPRIDTSLSKISRRWNERSEKKKQLRKAWIHILRHDANERMILLLFILNAQFNSVRFFMFVPFLIMFSLYLESSHPIFSRVFMYSAGLFLIFAFRSDQKHSKDYMDLIDSLTLEATDNEHIDK